MQKTVDLPWDFPTDSEMGQPIGRIHIGKHVGRLYMIRSTGEIVLTLSEDAKTDGSILWGPSYLGLTGFGTLEKV